MSYRSSFSQAYGGGRASPYASRVPGQPERTFSDLFEYVDPVDVGSRGTQEPPAVVPFESDDAPDVIHVKYMGQAYKLLFPPYSISESGVTVQEVRRRIAEALQQDPRRVRLVYKDRELRFDSYAIKKYGCKQNSELAAVVTESFNDYGGVDTHSSGDDSGSGSSLRPPEGHRPRGMSTVRHRQDDGRKSRNEEPKRPMESGGFLDPRYIPTDSRRRSQSPAPPRETATPQPTGSPIAKGPTVDPNTPMGKVQALQNLYYDKWLPDCQKFLISPPSDKAVRDREYRKLTESVMKYVIEAADAIDLDGDKDARIERKRVLGEANELLRRLDALQK